MSDRIAVFNDGAVVLARRKNLLASALAARGQEGEGGRGGRCHAWTGEDLHQATDPCQRQRAAYVKHLEMLQASTQSNLY